MKKEIALFENNIIYYSSYFINLYDLASNKNHWDEREMQKIYTELFELMQKQVRHYTVGDSSSVTLEIAEELKKSIYFCLGVYLKNHGTVNENIDLLKNSSISEIFLKGQNEVFMLFEKGKRLFKEVKETVLKINNISYNDTLPEIESFFKMYDVRLMAHDIPCMIDYQLLNPIPDLSGIEYINQYLNSLFIENKFCNKFSINNIAQLLQSTKIDTEQDLINISEYVFVNSIGLKLLDLNIMNLDIDSRNIIKLSKLISANNGNKMLKLINGLTKDILFMFEMEEYFSYFTKATQDLATRLETVKDLEINNIFISFENKIENKNQTLIV